MQRADFWAVTRTERLDLRSRALARLAFESPTLARPAVTEAYRVGSSAELAQAVD